MTSIAASLRDDTAHGPGTAFPPLPRAAIQDLAASRIREIANGAMGREDVAAFWFGESDMPTPGFIRDAAIASLGRGETFYSHNLGMPELRAELSVYLSRLHGADIGPERIAVTSSGVTALMLTAQMLVSPGDRVAVVTPVWPNVAELPRILGAEMVRVPLEVRDGRWQLDLDTLRAALTSETRALFLNSPNNPTGWTIDPETLAAVYEHCRNLGIWLIADDVYERLSFGNRPAAPSILTLADPGDRVISVNSFSKAWTMTGWRLGWMVAPAPFLAEMTKVVEYNTSCAPVFVQAGALAALQGGACEATVSELKSRLTTSRDLLIKGLRRHAAIEVPEADGAMYAFFRIKGMSDDMQLARDMIDKVGLGLAPGSAFGPEGAGWLRWCFAARPEKIADGLGRLGRFLGNGR